MMRKDTKKANPYLLATTVTVVFVIVMSLVRYLAGNELDPVDILLSAVIFWIFYLLSFQIFTKIIRKRRK
jgi:hypothetical protein